MTRQNKSGSVQGEISEYEQQRLDNIKRNEEYLKSLGFDKNSATAIGNSATKAINKKPKVQRKRKFDQVDDLDQNLPILIEPERRSRRIQSLTPDGMKVDDAYHLELAEKALEKKARAREMQLLEDIDIEELIDDEENTLRCKISAPDLQVYIEQSNNDHYEVVGNDIIEHTAYRMSYMSNKALSNRLKMISRAAGKHSYSKLLAFYYGLKLAKLEKLADATRAALERCGVAFE